MPNAIDQFKNLDPTKRLVVTLIGLLFVGITWVFVLSPLMGLGNTLVYDKPLDVRLGGKVWRAAIEAQPQLAEFEMSLEPDVFRKGESMKYPGTAHFFAKKINGCYQEKFTCRYVPDWQGSSFFAWSPKLVTVSQCVPFKPGVNASAQ